MGASRGSRFFRQPGNTPGRRTPTTKPVDLLRARVWRPGSGRGPKGRPPLPRGGGRMARMDVLRRNGEVTALKESRGLHCLECSPQRPLPSAMTKKFSHCDASMKYKNIRMLFTKILVPSTSAHMHGMDKKRCQTCADCSIADACLRHIKYPSRQDCSHHAVLHERLGQESPNARRAGGQQQKKGRGQKAPAGGGGQGEACSRSCSACRWRCATWRPGCRPGCRQQDARCSCSGWGRSRPGRP